MKTLQDTIRDTLRVQATIDVQQEIERSVTFMKDYLKQYPQMKTLVLGISGGQDSTLMGKLAQMAISQLREETQDEAYRFIAVRLPYGQQADAQDAIDAIAFMQADEALCVNIKDAVDATVASLTATGVQITDFNKGNIKARQRMIVQYAIAGARNGVVVGTDHAAEAVTGFYTKFGDGGADIMPLWRLTKRQGRAMLMALGAPEHLYLKQPTADLEEDLPLLPDEVALGVSYEEIDDYLEGKTISSTSARKIENWYQRTEHKRRVPITVFDDFWKKTT